MEKATRQKSKQKFNYKVHVKQVEEDTKRLNDAFNSVKEAVKETHLRISQLQSIVKEIENEEIEITVNPIIRTPTLFNKWITRMKSKQNL